MTLNPFYVIALFQCPLKISGNLWFSDLFQSFRKYRKILMPANGLKIFLIYIQNVDIHACSITEHTILLSICSGSFNALKRYKMSVFSELY